MRTELRSLTSFMTDESLRLATFELWWRKQYAINPHAFPLELEPGLWDEALQTFDPHTTHDLEIEPQAHDKHASRRGTAPGASQ